MSLYIHNKTQGAVYYQGREVLAESFWEIPGNLIWEFATDDTLLADIVSGSAAISADGSTDISGISAQIDALKLGRYETRDFSGRHVTRIATTVEGWHYQPHAVEFTTSKFLNGKYNKGPDGSDLGFVTYKLYDSNDAEITQEADEINAVKTVIDWMPTHDYEVIGGLYYQAAAPTSDIRLWIIGVPDVPSAYGGSITFGQGGINLKHLGTGGGLSTDGRSSKFMKYDATRKTNKFRLILRHEAGVQHSAMLIWEIYKAP